MDRLVCLGLSHRTAPVELRERLGSLAPGAAGCPAVEEHAAIYRAIRDGDEDAAATAAAAHVDRTLEDYRREIQRRVFG